MDVVRDDGERRPQVSRVALAGHECGRGDQDMLWLVALAVGLAAGAVVGFLVEQTGLWPSVQSVASALVALVLSAMAMAIYWSLQPRGLGAVSAGISAGGLLLAAGCLLLAAALHVLIGQFGAAQLAPHRALILGCLGGLCGAIPVAWAMGVAARL